MSHIYLFTVIIQVLKAHTIQSNCRAIANGQRLVKYVRHVQTLEIWLFVVRLAYSRALQGSTLILSERAGIGVPAI